MILGGFLDALVQRRKFPCKIPSKKEIYVVEKKFSSSYYSYILAIRTYTLNLILIFFSLVFFFFTWFFCIELYINLLIFHWKITFFPPGFIFTVYSLTTSLLDWRFRTEWNMRVLVYVLSM